MKKILFITSELHYGGAEKMLTFLANELSKLKYEVIIYSYEGTDSEYNLESSINFIAENRIKKNYYLRRFQQAIQVRNKIKEINPDIVISFLTNQNVFSVLGTKFTKIPVIISERGDPYQNNSLVSRIKYIFYNFAEGIVFQSDGAKEFFSNLIQEKSKVIPNPVPLPQINNISQHNMVDEISFVGRFDINQKRQDLMISAFKKVVQLGEYQGVKLAFYGDGPDLIKIKELVKEEGIEEHVIFKGKIDNISEYIHNSKMFVLSSDFEGIPNALIEAMSLGLPVISTDCSPGGARLLIENNINGILVPRGSVDDIANAIQFYLDNPKIAKKYGDKAKEIIDIYSSSKIIRMWVNYIEEVISSSTK